MIITLQELGVGEGGIYCSPVVATFQETGSPLIDQEILFSYALGQVDVSIGSLDCSHGSGSRLQAQGSFHLFQTLVEVALCFHGETSCFLEEAH